MGRFSFLQRGNLADHACHVSLAAYTPAIALEGLLTGIDNVRHDVFLSPRFTDLARQHLSALIVKYGAVQEILATAEPSFRVPSVMSPAAAERARLRPADPGEFKRLLAELQVAALNRAKTESSISVDLVARMAIIKFLRAELAAQFAQVLERCRARLKGYEGPRASQPPVLRMRERLLQLQVGKKAVLRKVGQELFQTLREVEKETLARLRRSLFGEPAAVYDLFVNRLLFAEDGRDDFLNAEHYIMLGNRDRDPDHLGAIRRVAHAFLRALNPRGGEDEAGLDALLNAPENAHELTAGGIPEDTGPKGKAQRALLSVWVDMLEHEGAMENVIAAYEVVPLLPQYSPPINAQQLKNALISRAEFKRVEGLLEEQGKLSSENLRAAGRRVGACRGPERAKVAARFLRDFMTYHRDLRRLEALNSALDTVNVITNEKLRELSAVNNTLYEFLLPEEQKPAEDKVVRHVVIKADIRDSTTLIRTLLERGLNPASQFSLNFYEPVNKLLDVFGASKMFIEGDALILAVFEREGEPPFSVGRSCVLAREILGVVHAYNEHSRRAGLPGLELGIGISYQDSPPLYLMDGSSRIMISKALNESDRLSSCSKTARRYLPENATPFNVYTFQTVDDADTGGNPDEFLVRYNIGGIHITEQAFDKLQQEISLEPQDAELRTLWEREPVRLFSGVVPVASGGFHKLIVREGRVPHVNARGFSLKQWTDRRYYEVCTSPAIYALVERTVAHSAVVP